MKKTLIIFSVVACAGCVKSQSGFIGKVTYSSTLVVMQGESNTTGAALDASALPAELGVRSTVMILSNSTYLFDTLRIGTNNVSQGVGTYHGWELGLANSTDSGALLRPVYLAKPGIGGTTVADWDTGGTNFKRSLRIIDSAVSKLTVINHGNPPKIAIWYSQGINDAQGEPPTDTTVWKTKTKIILNALLARYPTAQIFMTHIQPSFTDMNLAITTICNEVANCHEIVISDIPGSGTLVHWPYATMKPMAARIVWTMKAYGYQ